MKTRVCDLFGIDPRSLALLRVALATILLWDLAIRVQDFTAFYTEAGILPIKQAAQYHDGWRWSLHLLSGSAGFQASLMALAAVCAAALLVGYRSRLAVVLSWVLLVSLHVRMPLVLNAGDSYLRLLLFWSMFLPLGQVWSWDARRRPRSVADADRPVLSMATVAVLFQVCITYWYSGFSKLRPVWLEGDAMDHVLRYSMFAKPLSDTLLSYPDLLRWAAQGTVYLELAGPFLLFIPWRTTAIRLALIAAFAAFHLGIQLTLHVGLFAFVALAGWSLFVPPSFWSAIGDPRRLSSWTEGWAGVHRQSASAAQTVGAANRGGWTRRVSNGLCLIFLVYIVGSWDFSTLRYRDMPSWLKVIGSATMLPQAWGMFQTAIPRDYWYVYRATLRNGRLVDVLEEGVLTALEPPTRRSEAFPNHRWRKLHARLVEVEHSDYRQPLVEQIYKKWNALHAAGNQIAILEMFSLTEEVGRHAQRGKRGVAPFARVGLLDGAGGGD